MGTKELTYKEKILYTLDSKIQAAKNDLGEMQREVVSIQNKVTATMRLVNNLNDARDEIDKLKQREPKADDGPETDPEA